MLNYQRVAHHPLNTKNQRSKLRPKWFKSGPWLRNEAMPIMRNPAQKKAVTSDQALLWGNQSWFDQGTY
jgi:hypothetical protein